jgi:acetoin utilization deacetylase AcuC-like enzyme
MRRTGFVWHERYMWQESGSRLLGFGREVEQYLQPGIPYMGPEPKRRIRNLLDATGLLEQLTPIAPRAATHEELARVHGEEYIARIERMSEEGGGLAGPATPLAHGSYEVALLAAGGVVAAVDAVLDGTVDNAYALVRPPGHHALRDQGLGLCIFANVAITARHLQRARGLGRVAVVDWDVHHGNGTQSLFYDDPSVLTISLHQANVQMDASTGRIDERGAGDGVGCNVNVPIPPGSGRGAYVAALERVVVPALHAFRPDFVLVACGVDANVDDPQGRMMLLPGAFRELTELLLAAADELCAGRVVAAHEGGYSEMLSPFCGLAVIGALRGVRTEAEDALGSIFRPGSPDQLLQPHQDEAIAAAAAAVGIGR